MRKLFAVAVLSLTATTGMFAQQRFGQQRGERTPPTPAEMVDRRVQMLTTLLTLDAAQQSQAKTIFTDEATAAQALRDTARNADEALRTAVKNGATDAQIDQLAAAVGAAHGQSLAIHTKAQAKFRSILNSTQKEKLDASRGFGMGGFGMGGPGGMRPMMGGGPHF